VTAPAAQARAAPRVVLSAQSWTSFGREPNLELIKNWPEDGDAVSEIMQRPQPGAAAADDHSATDHSATDPADDFTPERTSWRRVLLWCAVGVVGLVGIVLAVAIGPFADAAGSCGGG
jgi:hypothetical protein